MVNRQVNRREERKGGFVYTPPDPKKLKERAEKQGGAFDSYFKSGIDTFKPKVGENCVRILPPTFKDHEHFGYNIWVHGYIGADKSSYLCPKRMKGKKCPICEAARDAVEAGEKDEGDDIKAKERIIYWVIDRDGETDDPMVWSVSWTMDKDISARCEKRSGRILELDNPDAGHDVIFRRQGQGMKTRYIALQVDGDKTKLADRTKDRDRLLEFVEENPLDKILKYYDYDYLAGVLDGTADAKDEDLDEDEDEKPRRKRRGRDDDDDEEEERPRGKKRRGRDRDEDEDEDEDEKPKSKRRSRDDDEDEDDKPKRRKSRDDDEDEEEEKPRRRKSRDDDEDEDEDEKPKSKRKGRDDDEDEEEEKPRRRRSRGDVDEEDPADDDDDNGDDDEDDKPKSKRKSRDDDEDEDDKPRGRRRRR